MKQEENISILITDRDFQKILSSWLNYNESEKSKISREYNLSIDDIIMLRQIYLGLDFRSQNYPPEQINTALDETLWKIVERRRTETGKTTTRKIYEQFTKIAAILIVPLIIYTFYIHLDPNRLNKHDNAAQLITVYSQPGTITNMVLPDGTKVFLNAGSSISYPDSFKGKTRNVSLSGEAYFEVVKNKKMPMVVSSENFSLKVYGTSFNVNAYPELESAKITLVEGSISFSSHERRFNDKEEMYLKPGQTVIFYNNLKKLEIENKGTYLYTAWKDGLLVFKNVSFEYVLKQLSVKFNVDIKLISKNLASIPMDATFRNESINEILRLLSLGTPFKYSYGQPKKLSDGTFEKSVIYIEDK